MKHLMISTVLLTALCAGAAAASGTEASDTPWWKAPKAPVTAGATAGSAAEMRVTPSEDIHARLEAILPAGATLSGDPDGGRITFSIPIDRIEPGPALDKLVDGVTRLLIEVEGTHLTVMLPDADEAAAAAAGDALSKVLIARGVDVSAVSVEPGSSAEAELIFDAP